MERRKGIGFWVGILLCLVVAVILSDGLLLERAGGYTYPEFIQDINEKIIKHIFILMRKC